MHSMAEVLVTGGHGFLALHLIERLLKEGHRVRVLVRQKKPDSPLYQWKVDVYLGDILDSTSLTSAMKGCEVVFHTAGLVSYDPKQNEEMHKVNVEGTRLVGEAVLRIKVPRLIYTSSIAALGINHDPKVSLNEECSFNAQSLGLAYFDTKYGAEQELHKLKEQGLNYVVVNPSSILGPRDTRKKSSVYAGLIYRLNPTFAFPGGNNFVDVEDVVDGHMLAWEKGMLGERYILGGENLTFMGLINKTNKIIGRPAVQWQLFPSVLVFLSWILRILRRFGKKPPVTPELLRHMGTWYFYVDSSKAKRELGYNPKPVDAAIQKTLSWLKEEKYIS